METKKENQLLKETASAIAKATKLFIKYRKENDFKNYDAAMEILFNAEREINLNLFQSIKD